MAVLYHIKAQLFCEETSKVKIEFCKGETAPP